MFFFLIVGFICLVHYIIIVCYAGLKAAFSVFWLACATGCLGISIIISILNRYNIISKIPKTVFALIGTVTGILVIIFLFLFISVCSQMKAKPEEDVDCIVVLGAKVEGRRITKSLLKRLEAAKNYLDSNKDVFVIVSGGRGECEDISEAEAMYEYLIHNGIDEKRIIKEDKSTTTKENLLYSYDIAKEKYGEDVKIAIVTSNFHIFRAQLLAKKIGIKNVQGLAAKADGFLVVNYLFRECAALVKEKMLDNI